MHTFGVAPSVISAVACAVAVTGLAVLVIKLLSAALAYQTSGLAVNGTKITAYCGGLIKRVTVLKRENLIAVATVTTPLRKKAGIASPILHLKTNAHSNEIKIHIQKASLSEELEKLLVL